MKKSHSLVLPALISEDQTLYCPFCRDFDYNHLDGPVTTDNGSDWWGDGPVVRIPFKCEDGHRWLLCIGFHKGNQHIFAQAARVSRDKVQ
ncbi:MAG TPA: hypothetical protein P5567_11510 [Kiritimatiellia bacterium]|nr:hypothetical protein [Kiritimatiellia bacterium]HSA17488.1 hypothetical protein [Kiritimatiellia bacterium]